MKEGMMRVMMMMTRMMTSTIGMMGMRTISMIELMRTRMMIILTFLPLRMIMTTTMLANIQVPTQQERAHSDTDSLVKLHQEALTKIMLIYKQDAHYSAGCSWDKPIL